MKLRRAARLLIGDETGAMAPITAVMLVCLLALAALVIDVGVWYVQKRQLQAATDLAAMAAANEPANAAAVAGTVLGKNGYAAASLVSAEAGYYCPSDAADQHFSTSPCAIGAVIPSSPNAVRLTTSVSRMAILSQLVGGGGDAAIQTVAVAARVDEAGLSISSGLASADLPVSNAVLQSYLGTSGFSLSAAQYDGLVSTNVDAAQFFQSLGSRLGDGSGTYGQLLSGSATVSELLLAMEDALDAQSGNADVSAAISALDAVRAKLTVDPSVVLTQLFDLGIWQDQPVNGSGSPSALEAGLNVYQLMVFALQLGGSSHPVTIPLSGLNIPGLASATLQAASIEPPQSAYFAFGPVGVSVHTAQVRMQMALNIAGLLQTPIYVEAAQGDATLDDIACGADPATDATATVQATSGVASVYLGTASANAMSNFSQPVSVTPAPLLAVNVPLAGPVTVSGESTASAASSSPTELTFNATPAGGLPPNLTLSTQGYFAREASSDGSLAASDGWPAQVVSTGMASGLGSSLWNNLSLSVCTSSCIPASGAVTGLAGPQLQLLLEPVLAALDPLIDETLESMGVKLGTAEVMVSGLRCGVPVLVA